MMQYLATLRRVPDDVILSVATREFRMIDPSQCICGWVLREALARMANKDASEVDYAEYTSGGVCMSLANTYGGQYGEWAAIFQGVTNWEAIHIEDAFMQRVMQAAGV